MIESGKLLLASPGMHQSFFDRTVILLLEHNHEGSMGLILNRPSNILVSDVLPNIGDLASPDRLFMGGPVEEGTALVVADGDGVAGLQPLGLDESVAIDETNAHDYLDRVRVYNGYSGWSADQLEEEIAAGAWLLANSEPADAWDLDHETLWARTIKRREQIEDFLSEYPNQPWLN